MRVLCVIGNVASLVCVLVGGWLTWRGLCAGRGTGLTWDEIEDRELLREAVNPGARVGIGFVVAGAVLNTAASIGSLYVG